MKITLKTKYLYYKMHLKIKLLSVLWLARSYTKLSSYTIYMYLYKKRYTKLHNLYAPIHVFIWCNIEPKYFLLRPDGKNIITGKLKITNSGNQYRLRVKD